MTLSVRIGSGLSFAWEEYTGPDSGYTQSYVFSDGQSQAQLLIDCAWSDFTSGKAVNEILGTSSRVLVAGFATISRTLPMAHPIFPFLRATKISSVVGLRNLAKEASVHAAVYERARISVIYSQLNFSLMTDAQLFVFSNKEHDRWMSRISQPALDVLVRGVGAWKWAQGGSTNDVRFGIPERLGKENLNLLWHKVPAGGLFGFNFNAKAANQEDGLGRVNSALFLGYPTETLLLTGIAYKENMVPQLPATVGMSAFRPSLCYDVLFTMQYFDPPLKVNATVARGHNVFPPPKAGPWALVTNTGATNGTRVYQTYDFDTLFLIQ